MSFAAPAVASECRYRTADGMAAGVAATIGDLIRDALAARDRAALAVPGGSTPIPVYRHLAGRDLGWDRVDLTLTDERWVAGDHPDSNAAMLRRELLTGFAARARFVDLPVGDSGAADTLRQCDERLGVFAAGFDLVVLGMGSDGHTASLFPGASGTAAAMRRGSGQNCAKIEPSGAPFPRLTLTLDRLLGSRRIALLIGGAAKWRVYQEAGASVESVERYPVAAILHQTEVPVDVYWSA